MDGINEFFKKFFLWGKSDFQPLKRHVHPYVRDFEAEESLYDMLSSKYGVELPDVYLGELLIHWDRFSDAVLNFPQDMAGDKMIDAIYYMLIRAAGEIRRYTSDRPGFENIWSEQTFNQIVSVIEMMQERLKPLFEMELSDAKLKKRFLAEYQGIKDYYQEFCTGEDSYWITLLENIEKPLNQRLGFKAS